MPQLDVRGWALKGAEQRLVEIAGEAQSIFRHFPELRGKGRGFDSGAQGTQATRQQTGATRRRRKMSAAARKAISARMTKYWAARREGKRGQPAKSAANKATRKLGPRTMSPEARKRISDAQKARWAKQKAAKAETGKPLETSNPKRAARRGSRKKR